MIRVAKHSFLIVGVIVLVAGSGLASTPDASKGSKSSNAKGVNQGPSGILNAKLVLDPKVVVDPKTVVNPKYLIDAKVSMVVSNPKTVIDPKTVINPKFLIDAKVVNAKTVIDPKVTKVIIDPKIGVDPKVVNPKFLVDAKVVNAKFTKVIVDPKFSKVIVDPKFTAVIVNPKYTKVLVTKVIVAQVSYPPVIVLPYFGGVYLREIAEYLGVEAPVVPVQLERFLRLHNDTAEKMTVYVRNHTADVSGEWDWFPEPPSPEAAKWFSFVLEPGEVLEPKLGTLPMAGDRIRLIVETGTQRRETFKETDFWLVPEATPMGEHLYYSEARQTFDLYLNSIK